MQSLPVRRKRHIAFGVVPCYFLKSSSLCPFSTLSFLVHYVSSVTNSRAEIAAVIREDIATKSTLVTYVERSLEFLWLLTAAMVPLIFVDKTFMLSEAVNAYVEVPKTTAFRTLVGLMAMLWIVEWVVKGGLNRPYNTDNLLSRFRNWLEEQPTRWVVVAAVIYGIVSIIATVLSQNFWISLWGEVSGQYGYSMYTTVSYVIMFVIIVTHLKTQDQLWRLLAVLATTGGLVALYAIVQHYGLDPLDQGEAGSFRVASTMANSVFAGAFLVGTTLLTVGVGMMVLDKMGWMPIRVVMWIFLIAAQMMAVFWTGARGSFLVGVPVGLVVFLALPALATVSTSLIRDRVISTQMLVLLGSLVVLGGLVLIVQLDLLDLGGLPRLPDVRLLLGWLGLIGWLSTIVQLFPTRFDADLRSFARAFLVVASGILITMLVVVLTPAPSADLNMEFRDMGFLPDSNILLTALGILGLLTLLLLQFPARFDLKVHEYAKKFLVLASGLLIALIVGTAGIAAPASPTDNDGATTGITQIQEPAPTVQSAVTGRGLSYRTEIWDASWKLIINRTWFEYENLSLSFLRPLIGYGPELFKYTFPLESPLGGMLSHSHNFFIHHAVEQGILGLFSSVSIFLALFAVGLAQLWSGRKTYSTTHKWILLMVLATLAGRLAEMMVGVAREPDLILVWILLAIFVVLPSVMSRPEEVEAAALEGRPRLTRRERRTSKLSRNDRRARRFNKGNARQLNILQAAGMALVIAVVIFLGWLTWDKNVDYAWAAILAAEARDSFQDGRFQESQRMMRRASAKAPDVPSYYHNLSGIYEAYRTQQQNNPDGNLPTCAEFYSLEPKEGSSTEHRCAEEAYRANLAGFRKNITSPQAKLSLANTTLVLATLGFEGKSEEAIRYYVELTQMIPSSWPLYNSLGTAYLRLGQPEKALESLQKSLTFTGRSTETSQALYLQGLAYQRSEDLPNAIDALERSLELSRNGGNSPEIRRQLANIYDTIVVEHIRNQENEEALVVLDRYLGATTGSASSARPLYLKGVVFRQQNELEMAVDVLEESIDVNEKGQFAKEIHELLANIYAVLGDPAQAEAHSKLAEELSQS